MRRFNVLECCIMVVMTVMCTTFASCGSDKDDDLPGGSAYIGVHRIDVQFSENAVGKSTITIFNGIKADGSVCKLYENGKQLTLDLQGYTWSTQEVRSLSIETENGCAAETVSILLSDIQLKPMTSDVTITIAGYINNKRTATRTYTLPTGKKMISIAFSTDAGGQSSYVVDEVIME